jgi:hypothetical protein
VPIGINRYMRMAMKRIMLSITGEMERALETERKKRMLDSIPETVRLILSEYLSDHSGKRDA